MIQYKSTTLSVWMGCFTCNFILTNLSINKQHRERYRKSRSISLFLIQTMENVQDNPRMTKFSTRNMFCRKLCHKALITTVLHDTTLHHVDLQQSLYFNVQYVLVLRWMHLWYKNVNIHDCFTWTWDFLKLSKTIPECISNWNLLPAYLTDETCAPQIKAPTSHWHIHIYDTGLKHGDTAKLM